MQLNKEEVRIYIKYFGMIESLTGREEEVYEMVKELSVAQLLEQLDRKYPGLNERHFRIAVNREIRAENTPLGEGDIVAIMPAFAGG